MHLHLQYNESIQHKLDFEADHYQFIISASNAIRLSAIPCADTCGP